MKDEVLDRLEQFKKANEDEIGLTESITVNGNRFLPAGTVLKVIKEGTGEPVIPSDSELLNYGHIIVKDLKEDKMPLNFEVLFEKLYQQFGDDFSDEEYDEAIEELLEL